ncbi:MAG: polysaccharide biosynthesis tyrosine autokinase [Cyanobacteria bacterium P01_F01_bin.150]
MNLDANSPSPSTGTPLSSLPASTTTAGEFDALLKRGLNFWPLLRTIKRKTLLIAGLTVLMAGLAALKTKQAPSIYQGSFELLVEPITSQGQLADPTTLTRGLQDAQRADGATDYATQLRILTGPGLLREIAAEVSSRDPNYINFTADDLARSLLVRRVGDTALSATKIISVSYEAEDADLVETVLKATSDRYLLYSLEDRKTRFGEGVKFIEDQLPEIQQRVSSLQDRLQRLQQRFNVVNPDKQSEQLTAQIGTITDFQFSTQRELRETLALRDNLQQQLALSPSDALAASTLSQSPRYQTLLAELQTIESQIRTESARFNPASPVIRALEVQRQETDSLLRQEAQAIIGTPVDPKAFVFQDPVRLDLIRQLLTTNNQLEVLKARSQEIAQSKNNVTQQLEQFPEVARRHAEIQAQLDIAQRTLDQLLTQRELLRIESAQTEVPWEQISAPLIDRDEFGNPIPYPQSSKMILFALLGGPILGTALAIFLEKLQNVFFVTEDVQDNLDLPLAGVIPYCQMEEQVAVSLLGTSSSISDHQQGHQAALSSRGLMFMEAFSSLYASMLTPMTNELTLRSLVVSSAEPGDGKTTVVQNLAQTVAAIGKKVLVVDANLYRPTLHQLFSISNGKGLGDVVNGDVSLDDVLSMPADNLFVLTSGQSSIGNSRLLASEAMQALMKMLHTKFDLVIYDAPHLMGLTDANFLTSQTDGMYLVIGIEKTKYSVQMQVMSQLSTYNTRVLGLVANHLKAGTKTSYGYRSKYLQPQVTRSFTTASI